MFTKAELDARKERLQRLIGEKPRLDGLQIEGFRGGDQLEQVVGASDADTEARIIENRFAIIAMARIANQKIDAGTYAECSICDGEIPMKRLVAVDHAIFCIPCQERFDDHEIELASIQEAA